ncbi:hypothetical protein NDU88_001101 [Pleurodeles waltl]|uniref:Uncharacterized protein n=1 Tax=Pleurodeles waltl TaxID=8319 RepID=A0AAV7UTU0_PLEWA|nr:hypothetical protein NDU88_001101 [Pleurodeles waltl]
MRPTPRSGKALPRPFITTPPALPLDFPLPLLLTACLSSGSLDEEQARTAAATPPEARRSGRDRPSTPSLSISRRPASPPPCCSQLSTLTNRHKNPLPPGTVSPPTKWCRHLKLQA